MLNKRFVDRGDKEDLLKSYSDFVSRGYSKKAKYTFVFFVFFTTGLLGFVVHNMSNPMLISEGGTVPMKNIVFLLSISVTALAIVSIFAVYVVYKFSKTILYTEFQSMIFASSSKVGSAFFLIIGPDGELFYHNNQFFQDFAISGSTSREILDEFLTFKGFDDDLKSNLRDAVEHKRNMNLVKDVKINNLIKKTLVNVGRPRNLSNFLVISGRHLETL